MRHLVCISYGNINYQEFDCPVAECMFGTALKDVVCRTTNCLCPIMCGHYVEALKLVCICIAFTSGLQKNAVTVGRRTTRHGR